MDFLARAGRLLFQGDSITDAFRKPAERNDAYRLGNGYVLLVAGELQARPRFAGLECENRGVAGDRIADLAARWDADCLALMPDALSLLAGINDALRDDGARGEEFARAYDALIARTCAALPRARLALLEPFALPLELATPAVLARLAENQRAARAIAARHGACFVSLQAALTAAADATPAAWCYDGVHPTARAHWLIARRWLDELAPA